MNRGTVPNDVQFSGDVPLDMALENDDLYLLMLHHITMPTICFGDAAFPPA